MSATYADMVQVNYEGSITLYNDIDGVLTNISQGDNYTARYTFDTAAPASGSTANSSFYSLVSFSMILGSHIFEQAVTGDAMLNIYNDAGAPNTKFDAIEANLYQEEVDVQGIEFEELDIFLQLRNNTLASAPVLPLNSLALDNLVFDPFSWASQGMSLEAFTADSDVEIEGNFTSIEVINLTPVPVPGSILFLLSALGSLAAFSRIGQ